MGYLLKTTGKRLEGETMFKSLLHQFIAILIIPIILILTITQYTYKQMQKDQEVKLETYCTTTIENININFSLLMSNVSKIASAFSTSRDVQLYLSNCNKGVDLAQRQKFSDIVELSSTFLPYLLDIVLIDSPGNSTSLVSYLSSDLHNYIRSLSKESQNVGKSYSFYINPKTNNVYIVYLAPIYVTKSSTNYGNYTGSIAILCKSSIISKIINSTNDILIEIVNKNNNEVLFSNKALFSKENINRLYSSSSQHRSKDIIGTNLAIKGTYLKHPFSSYSSIGKESTLNNFLLAAGPIFLIILVYLAITIHLVLIRPIDKLNMQIKNMNFTDGKIKIKSTAQNEIGSIAKLINQMVDRIVTLNQENLNSKVKLYEMEISKKETQLYAYQSQINPHFLYNMLQCMRGISLMNGMEQIARICTNMADLFRYSIKGENYVSLNDEITIVDKYLYMISVRFQNRITYTFQIDESTKSLMIPKMILQPIVENSIFHGLEQITEQGKLYISSKCIHNDLIISVKDNGIGFNPEQLEELNHLLMKTSDNFDISHCEKEGIGIINIHNKIQLYEGNDYGLSIHSSGGETEVIIKLKIIKNNKEKM